MEMILLKKYILKDAWHSDGERMPLIPTLQYTQVLSPMAFK